MAPVRKSHCKQTRSSHLAFVSITTCSDTSSHCGYVVAEKGQRQNKVNFPSLTKRHLIAEEWNMEKANSMCPRSPDLATRTRTTEAQG